MKAFCLSYASGSQIPSWVGQLVNLLTWDWQLALWWVCTIFWLGGQRHVCCECGCFEGTTQNLWNRCKNVTTIVVMFCCYDQPNYVLLQDGYMDRDISLEVPIQGCIPWWKVCCVKRNSWALGIDVEGSNTHHRFQYQGSVAKVLLWMACSLYRYLSGRKTAVLHELLKIQSRSVLLHACILCLHWNTLGC